MPRATLFEEIRRISNEDEEILFTLMEEIDNLEIAAVGFRWNATSTQRSQDQILKLYEQFLGLIKVLHAETPGDQKEALTFPPDHDVAIRQLRK